MEFQLWTTYNNRARRDKIIIVINFTIALNLDVLLYVFSD